MTRKWPNVGAALLQTLDLLCSRHRQLAGTCPVPLLGCQIWANGLKFSVYFLITLSCRLSFWPSQYVSLWKQANLYKKSSIIGSPLIRKALLPSKSVLIREVSFGERENHIYVFMHFMAHDVNKFVSLLERCPLLYCILCPSREGPVY